MLTALQLIFSPFRAWEKITVARKRAVWILCVYLLPLMAMAVAAEGYALARWGEKRSGLDFIVKVSGSAALRYAVAQFLLLLASIVIGAKCLQWVTHSFQVASDFGQCFCLMAYGFSPILLARFLDAAPGMNTWACWALGALLSSSVLYHGVALVLRPEQTKGFGIYLVSLIVVVLSSVLSHFMAVTVLHGKAWY
ncbi:MAG: YIP1 family protein [Verrucomicrobia bacterium]|nr:YIP1 family protein [Verrucomicrobiota bacterium]